MRCSLKSTPVRKAARVDAGRELAVAQVIDSGLVVVARQVREGTGAEERGVLSQDHPSAYPGLVGVPRRDKRILRAARLPGQHVEPHGEELPAAQSFEQGRRVADRPA